LVKKPLNTKNDKIKNHTFFKNRQKRVDKIGDLIYNDKALDVAA